MKNTITVVILIFILLINGEIKPLYIFILFELSVFFVFFFKYFFLIDFKSSLYSKAHVNWKYSP